MSIEGKSPAPKHVGASAGNAAEGIAERLELIRESYRLTGRGTAPMPNTDWSRASLDDCVEEWRRLRDGLASGERRHATTVLYLHIPFCATRCFYCHCCSHVARSADDVVLYLDRLHTEIDRYGEALAGHPFSAFYVGGGTPSLLSAEQVDALGSHLSARFTRAPDFHFCAEMNPATTTLDKLLAWRSHGVSRVSFGVQSLSDDVLANINRAYQTEETVARAIALAREAGIEAANIDVVAGLPGDTEATFLRTLERSVALGPDSICVYRWLLDTATRYAPYHPVLRQEEERQRDRLIQLAREFLTKAAAHDEQRQAPPPPEAEDSGVNNVGVVFRDSAAAPNRYEELSASGASVLGIGYGARSRIHGALSYTVEQDWHLYLDGIANPEKPIFRTWSLDPRGEMVNYVVAGLEMSGVSDRAFEDRFGVRFSEVFGAELDHLVANDIVICTDGHWTIRADVTVGDQIVALSLFNDADELRRRLEYRLADSGVAPDKAEAAPHASAPVHATHPAETRDDNVVLRLDETCEIEDLVAPVVGAGARRVDIHGGDVTADARFLPLLRRLRALHVKEVVAWSDGGRFAEDAFAAEAVAHGLTGAVIAVGPGSGPSGAPRESAVAALAALRSRGLASLVLHARIGTGDGHVLRDVIDLGTRLGVDELLVDSDADLDLVAVSDILHGVEHEGFTVHVFDRGTGEARWVPRKRPARLDGADDADVRGAESGESEPRPEPERPAGASDEGPTSLDSRPDSLRVTFTDRKGRLGERVFFLGRLLADDAVFLCDSDVGLVHWDAPQDKAFGLSARILVLAMARLGADPPTAENVDRWTDTIRRLHERSPLALRFDCRVERVG